MKNIFLLYIIVCCISDCFGQDTVERKNRLSDSVIERFYVLKSDPEIKQGPYKAFFRRKTLIALGNYRNNLKTGIWQFFTTRGVLIQKYNYDKKTFTYGSPMYDTGNLSFLFDDTLKKGGKVALPVKIGGSYYGFIPYMNLFRVPFETWDIQTDTFDASIELLISPMGRLADYTVHIQSGYYDYDRTFKLDINLFDEEDRTFKPATLNGTPVLSRIIIKCFITFEGGLDFN
ncbi:MAG: hypothetical protein ACHQIM_22530 [Sphingobacteriales bacterium]